MLRTPRTAASGPPEAGGHCGPATHRMLAPPRPTLDTAGAAATPEECWMCWSAAYSKPGGRLVSPCRCSGTIGHMHQRCLEELRRGPPTRSHCATCSAPYPPQQQRRVPLRRRVWNALWQRATSAEDRLPAPDDLLIGLALTLMATLVLVGRLAGRRCWRQQQPLQRQGPAGAAARTSSLLSALVVWLRFRPRTDA